MFNYDEIKTTRCWWMPDNVVDPPLEEGKKYHQGP
jgi:hypothetical protein